MRLDLLDIRSAFPRTNDETRERCRNPHGPLWNIFSSWEEGRILKDKRNSRYGYVICARTRRQEIELQHGPARLIPRMYWVKWEGQRLAESMPGVEVQKHLTLRFLEVKWVHYELLAAQRAGWRMPILKTLRWAMDYCRWTPADLDDVPDDELPLIEEMADQKAEKERAKAKEKKRLEKLRQEQAAKQELEKAVSAEMAKIVRKLDKKLKAKEAEARVKERQVQWVKEERMGAKGLELRAKRLAREEQEDDWRERREEEAKLPAAKRAALVEQRRSELQAKRQARKAAEAKLPAREQAALQACRAARKERAVKWLAKRRSARQQQMQALLKQQQQRLLVKANAGEGATAVDKALGAAKVVVGVDAKSLKLVLGNSTAAAAGTAAAGKKKPAVREAKPAKPAQPPQLIAKLQTAKEAQRVSGVAAAAIVQGFMPMLPAPAEGDEVPREGALQWLHEAVAVCLAAKTAQQLETAVLKALCIPQYREPVNATAAGTKKGSPQPTGKPAKPPSSLPRHIRQEVLQLYNRVQPSLAELATQLAESAACHTAAKVAKLANIQVPVPILPEPTCAPNAAAAAAGRSKDGAAATAAAAAAPAAAVQPATKAAGAEPAKRKSKTEATGAAVKAGGAEPATKKAKTGAAAAVAKAAKTPTDVVAKAAIAAKATADAAAKADATATAAAGQAEEEMEEEEEEYIQSWTGRRYPRSLCCRPNDKRLEDLNSDEDVDGEYEVERILDEVSLSNGGGMRYLVKWRGYEVNIGTGHAKGAKVLGDWEPRSGISHLQAFKDWAKNKPAYFLAVPAAAPVNQGSKRSRE